MSKLTRIWQESSQCHQEETEPDMFFERVTWVLLLLRLKKYLKNIRSQFWCPHSIFIIIHHHHRQHVVHCASLVECHHEQFRATSIHRHPATFLLLIIEKCLQNIYFILPGKGLVRVIFLSSYNLSNATFNLFIATNITAYRKTKNKWNLSITFAEKLFSSQTFTLRKTKGRM